MDCSGTRTTAKPAARHIDLRSARAHWLTPDVIAWPRHSGLGVDGSVWELCHCPDAGLTADGDGISGGGALQLVPDAEGLSGELRARYPHLANHIALRLVSVERARVEAILRGQFAIARSVPSGRLVEASGLQVPGVLDSLHAAAMAGASLGVSWNDGVPTLRVWAPTARDVRLLLWDSGADGSPGRLPMVRDDAGAWSIGGEPSWKNSQYRYEVEVFSPGTCQFETNSVTDPYSIGLTLNSRRSLLLDLSDPCWMPPGWASSTGPDLDSEVDQTIYELHVRDFSMSDPDLPEHVRGSYLAFAHDGHGRRHLADLGRAGLNTIHLLPTFDIATIEEDTTLQTTPEGELRAFAPTSGQQQARVMAQARTDAYNWGYDPLHFMTPEGSYASSNAAASDGRRVQEFRTMVTALHQLRLRVVLDQVYNHTPASGQDPLSVLDRIVPGYYHRLDATGQVETSTCCHNLGTEHAMAQKLMVDSCVVWARDYRVDGFRFDLMGHHSRQTMEAVRAALDGLTREADGVDGSRVTLYGEGWDFGEVAGNQRFQQASQGQLEGTGIGTFNDRLRDGVRGGSPFDEDPRKVRGFATGGTNPNHTDLVQLALAGNLADFEFRSQATGHLVTGADVDYNGTPAGYGSHPNESINYVDAHDNETLFDIIALKMPHETSMAHRIRINHLALATTALSQSPSFWHAGADLLRSKSLDRDSYDSGDWFNILDFTGQDNGFGRGLPPSEKNGDKWDLMRPLLADGLLVPEPSDIRHAAELSKELLRMRFSSPLFRLGEAHLIRQKVGFPVSGTDLGSEQVVVMHIDDTVGADVDPKLDRIVVVFNASGEEFSAAIPGLEGVDLALHEVQAGSVDPVVRQARLVAGAASVPARTVAVFVGVG